MKRFFFLVLIILVFFVVDAHALVVNAKSVSSGTYEDGEFTPGGGSFEAKYRIDEAAGTVTLEKMIENNREGRIEKGASYEITNILMSKGPSALLVSRNKKGQKIITAVREADLGASEILMIGDDFYEFCRAANGKLYLEYGEVTKSGR
ncbi:MAG: hypothetical protein U9R44_00705 [Candidatus Omnitrophota bacterium]|nr:hypothetical protein [Candidatus Omnitrophota bacterium]